MAVGDILSPVHCKVQFGALETVTVSCLKTWVAVGDIWSSTVHSKVQSWASETVTVSCLRMWVVVGDILSPVHCKVQSGSSETVTVSCLRMWMVVGDILSPTVHRKAQSGAVGDTPSLTPWGLGACSG